LEQALPRVERTSRPFGFLAAFAFWWVAIGWSALPMSTLQALTAMLKFLTAIGMVWCVYRAVDIVSAFLERQAARTDTALDEMLAAFIRGSLRVVVVAFGVLFILSNIGLNVNSLIAGIGIGGIAVALAAKDPLENLLAGITLLLERPFQVGDLVVVGETRGTIEEMGLRSTRLRTFENTLVTLPNAEMMRGKLDNFQKRKVRRVRATISVTYSTPPDKIEAFCEGIREIIRAHPYTAKDKYHVWFNQFGPSSLDILVFCGLTAGDWATELRERHRLFLDIMRLAQELGVEFAYPTQTIYVAQPKEHAPIFPEEGTILAANEPRLRAVRDKAREIVRSEVGGEGVIPDPVGYDTVIGTTHTPSADSF
jgi:MscS family membrane protein